MKSILYIGLDVHKESISIAIAEPGRKGEVRAYGKISNDLHAMEKVLTKLRKAHGKDVQMHFCYEAGPCGYVLARRFAQWGIDCIVVAPSKIARRSGDKVKTDRRDAEKLARLLRSGDLDAIYIPEPTDEAIRDLCRARTDAVDDQRRAKQRLKSFLLQHGYQYQGKAIWSPAHMRYLRELVLPHPAMKTILEESLTAVDDACARVQRCEDSMQNLLQTWRLKPAVDALMAFKGFQTVAAMITISELGSLPRFEHPRQLMGFLGLVPSEDSTGEGRKQGGITKCGNPHARWLLTECSQHYANSPKVSKELSKRQQGQPASVIKTSWKAQNRLHGRFMRLAARRVNRNKIVVAIARELVAFIWEALRELPCYEQNEPATHPSHA
jgi:transposase